MYVYSSHNSLTPSLPQPVKFRAERCTDAPANRKFSGPVTSTFNVSRFYDYPSTSQCNKRKHTGGFDILHHYWSFSSDIMAAKGLIATIVIVCTTGLNPITEITEVERQKSVHCGLLLRLTVSMPFTVRELRMDEMTIPCRSFFSCSGLYSCL